MKFSAKRVLQEVRDVQSGQLSVTNSEVYEVWASLADGWLASGDGEYHLEGFVGFNDRIPEQIVMDFHLNNRLIKPLTQKQFDQYMDALTKGKAVSVPLVVVIKDGVVDGAPDLCRDGDHAEQVFKAKVLEHEPAASGWDEEQWDDALDSGYVELAAVKGSVCLCWADSAS